MSDRRQPSPTNPLRINFGAGLAVITGTQWGVAERRCRRARLLQPVQVCIGRLVAAGFSIWVRPLQGTTRPPVDVQSVPSWVAALNHRNAKKPFINEKTEDQNPNATLN